MGTKWKNPLVWFRGLLAAFISGGAGAVAACGVAMAQTPQQYNLQDGVRNVLVMFAGSFVVTGLLGAAAYLQKSPLPELEDEGAVSKQTTS